jgi:hypothetical protein
MYVKPATKLDWTISRTRRRKSGGLNQKEKRGSVLLSVRVDRIDLSMRYALLPLRGGNGLRMHAHAA